MKTITELEKHGAGFLEVDKINVAEVDDSSGLSPEEGGFSQNKISFTETRAATQQGVFIPVLFLNL